MFNSSRAYVALTFIYMNYITCSYIYILNAVWNELEKENKGFFEAYAQSKSKDDRMSEEETNQMIQKMISDSSKGASND